MPSQTRLPDRFPVESKYVLEVCGSMVRRYVELPNGERFNLAPRKALTCRCLAQSEIDRGVGKQPAKAAA